MSKVLKTIAGYLPKGAYCRSINVTSRSEGEAERDIGSPCMIGLGLVVVEKFFRRRRRRRRRPLGLDPKQIGFCIKNIEYRHFSSQGVLLGKTEGLLKMLAMF